GDLSAGQHLDVGVAGELVDEVARHGRRQVVAAGQQVDPAGAGSQEDRGLPGRVAAADDRHRVADVPGGLFPGRRVVDAGTLQAFQAIKVEAAVAGAGGDDHGAGAD